MAEKKTKSFDADVTFEGTVKVDGAATITGNLTTTAGLVGLKLVSAPTGTDPTAIWATGAAPVLTIGNYYITLTSTASASTFRIPCWPTT